MASVLDVADCCPKIIVSLLRFLGRPSPRSPAVEEAATILLLVLSMAYVAGVIISHFADLVLAYLHLAAAAPASATAMPFAELVRFIVLVFTLVSVWLLVIAVWLAFFVFLIAGNRGIWPGFS